MSGTDEDVPETKKDVSGLNKSSGFIVNMYVSDFFTKLFKGIVTRGICNKAVEKNLLILRDVPDKCKMQEKCDKAVEQDHRLLIYVPDRFRTQEMFDKAVEKDFRILMYVPDYFNIQELC